MTSLRTIGTLLLYLLASCAPAIAEDCPVSNADKFLPIGSPTPPPGNGLPAPPTGNDCAFYNWAWEAFLHVTQPDNAGHPAFVNYPSIEAAFPKVFPSVTSPASPMTLSVRNIEPMLNESTRSRRRLATSNAGDPAPVLTDGVMQASQGGPGAVAVDQNGNPIFYSIRLNSDFAGFIKANGLDEVDRLLADPSNQATAVPAELEIRPGAMELKSSWMIVEGPLDRYSNYIVIPAKVPFFKNVPDASGGGTHLEVDTSRPLRDVNVAMLGLHVVGAVDGHPELIWATFEHADDMGNRDVAPAASANPDATKTPPQTIDGAGRSYPLFAANTPIGEANNPVVQPIGSDQRFAKPTSIFRMYPGSAAAPPDDPDPKSPFEDPAVYTLNRHVGGLFSERDPSKVDRRRNYRLVGAVWIDQPRRDFNAGLFFEDDDKRLAGENRLSNVSIESFTQPAVTGAPHCFSCHDTQAQDRLPGGKQLPARRINVSHIFSIVAAKYLSTKR